MQKSITCGINKEIEASIQAFSVQIINNNPKIYVFLFSMDFKTDGPVFNEVFRQYSNNTNE